MFKNVFVLPVFFSLFACDIPSNCKFPLIGRFAFEFPMWNDPLFLVLQCQETEMSLLIRGLNPLLLLLVQ